MLSSLPRSGRPSTKKNDPERRKNRRQTNVLRLESLSCSKKLEIEINNQNGLGNVCINVIWSASIVMFVRFAMNHAESNALKKRTYTIGTLFMAYQVSNKS